MWRAALWSPYIVPLAVFAWMTIVAVAKIIGRAHSDRALAEQRLAMLQRGMTPEQVAVILQPAQEEEEQADPSAKISDPLRSLSNARRAGIVLVSVGFGLIGFGYVLTQIVQVREVLAVSATGLIPLAIGIGFFVDYHLQKRELSRFGLEVGADLPSPPPPH